MPNQIQKIKPHEHSIQLSPQQYAELEELRELFQRLFSTEFSIGFIGRMVLNHGLLTQVWSDQLREEEALRKMVFSALDTEESEK